MEQIPNVRWRNRNNSRWGHDEKGTIENINPMLNLRLEYKSLMVKSKGRNTNQNLSIHLRRMI